MDPDPDPRQLYTVIDSVSGMRGELLPGGVEEAQQVHLHAHVSHGKKVDALSLFSDLNSFQNWLDLRCKLGRSSSGSESGPVKVQ